MKLQIELEFDDELKDDFSLKNIVDVLSKGNYGCWVKASKILLFNMPADDEILAFLNRGGNIRFPKDSATFKNVKQALEYFIKRELK